MPMIQQAIALLNRLLWAHVGYGCQVKLQPPRLCLFPKGDRGG
ncbi:MAG: hypothetical protein ACLFWZ_01760 [Coleofasciculus sp.]